MRRFAFGATALAMLILPRAGRADLPPGAPVEDGILADVTPAGFDFIESIAPALLPEEMDLDPMQSSQELFWECDLDLAIDNMKVYFELNSLDIVPGSDTLRVDIDMDVWLNTQADPVSLGLDFDGFFCSWVSQTCYLWTDPFNVVAQMYISMEIVDPGNGDPPYLDATVPPPTHNLDTALTSDEINLDGCTLSDINDILSWLGIDLVDLLIDQAAGDLVTFIEEDLPAQVETAIEDAFDSATIVQEMDVLGVPLSVELVPGDIDITADGMRILYDGAFDAPPAVCVEAYDPGGSTLTEGPLPPMDGSATHHAAAYVSDDLLAAALYTVWRGGVLCYVIDPADMGFPLDTSFIALMVDEEDRHLVERLWFGESEPIALRTVPKNPPGVDIPGPHDVNAYVEDMGIEFYAMTQDRLARVVTVDVDIDAGVDITAPGDGSMSVGVVVDADHMDPVVSYNEFVPDLSPQIETNFGDIMSGLLDTILDGMLGDLTFGPMLFAGIGLTSLDIAPAGSADDYLGAYMQLGVIDPAAMEDLGCGEGGTTGCEGGCDSESCNSSCDVQGRHLGRGLWTGNLLLLSGCLAFLVYKRRRG